MNIDDQLTPTASGRKVNPLLLKASDIVIDDVAHHLSNICRFTGAVRRFYSVAEHSVRVCNLAMKDGASIEVCLWALLHDASEAYLNDVVRPLKHRAEFAFYRAAEHAAMDAVVERFGLIPDEPAMVKTYDLRLLATERRDLLAPDPDWNWAILDGVEPLDHKIEPSSPDAAFLMFMGMFHDLDGDVELKEAA